jgi:hypothetical protein
MVSRAIGAVQVFATAPDRPPQSANLTESSIYARKGLPLVDGRSSRVLLFTESLCAAEAAEMGGAWDRERASSEYGIMG